MPIYEYRCEECKNIFERLVFAGDKENVYCPQCDSKDVVKIMSACSFMGASIGTCAADSPKGFS